KRNVEKHGYRGQSRVDDNRFEVLCRHSTPFESRAIPFRPPVAPFRRIRATIDVGQEDEGVAGRSRLVSCWIYQIEFKQPPPEAVPVSFARLVPFRNVLG